MAKNINWIAIAKLKDDPKSDSVHHPFTAFNQGWDACLQQFTSSENPYPNGETRRWWDYGFWEARKSGD